MSVTTFDPALAHASGLTPAQLASLTALNAVETAETLALQPKPAARMSTWKRPMFRFTLGRRSLPEIIRRIHEPLLAMLRLSDNLEVRSFDPVAARVIEQQSRILEELTNLTEELLSIMDAEQFVRVMGQAKPPAAEGLPCNRIYNVVLVADDTAVLNSLRIALLCAGCRVLPFRSAEDAVLALQNVPQAVDLVITDMQLAGKEDGLLLIESLRREMFPSVPAIVLSGTDSDTLREPSLMQNIQVLPKPLNLVALKQAVSTLL
jgi:CheY-like chemotaxis protein